MADLKTTVGGLELATPVIAASGTYGYGCEYDGLVDWSMVGAVSVKGISLEPVTGHPPPRMVETAAGMLNAIGLQNIGFESFVTDKLPALCGLGPRVVVNCFGADIDAYAAIVERLDGCKGISAIEVNLSSPNKREWAALGAPGAIPAADAGITAEIVGRVRRATTLPLWVKLSPNVTDITTIAAVAEAAGADAIVAINTLRAMAVDVASRRPALAPVSGGLSGPAIKPVALYMVREIARTVSIPVVGVGGIVSGRDAAEFIIAGACAVQVGTASLYDPGAPARVARELDSLLDDLGVPAVAGLVGTLAEEG